MARGRPAPGILAIAAFGGLVVCAGLLACTAIAGAGGKEVDVCFDGCDGGSTAPEASRPQPPVEASVEAGPPIPTGDGGCTCPAGTERKNGVCTLNVSPTPNVQCTAPMQLPDNCEMKLSLRICDTDPPFSYASQCVDPGEESRPSIFVRLGQSPTGQFQTVTQGPYVQARPPAACDKGGSPCGHDARTGVLFRSLNAPNNTLFAFGKKEGTGCDEVVMDVSFSN